MTNSMELPKRIDKDPQERQIDVLALFVDEKNLSGDEMYAAYQIALGILPEETTAKQTVREEVYTLAKQMDGYMNEGLAANRIVDLIEKKQAHESIPETYEALVGVLRVTDNEKYVLRSIVTKKRAGMLTVTDVDTGKDIVKIHIPEEAANADHSKHALAFQLLKHLTEYKDRKIEISFEE